MKSKVQLISHIKKEQRKNHMHIVLLILVLILIILAFSSIADLDWEDKVPISMGFLLFLYGLIFFTCLYHALNNIFIRTTSGQRIIKNYHLSIGDVFEINNKLVSTVQAIFCCITGLCCGWYSCRRDILKTSHYISEAYAWFGAAYFLYDIWAMYRVHSAKTQDYRLTYYLQTNAVIVGHHIFIGAFGFLVITYLRGGLGDCVFGFVYLMEASTPFVSARSILSKLRMKNSKLYVINGVMMLITFFICRIIMFPCVILLYAHSIGLDYITAIKSLPNGCKVSILLLLLPQIYWFLLMIQGATQLLKRKASKSTTNSTKKKLNSMRN